LKANMYIQILKKNLSRGNLRPNSVKFFVIQDLDWSFFIYLVLNAIYEACKCIELKMRKKQQKSQIPKTAPFLMVI
jgi:hypothetical protein